MKIIRDNANRPAPRTHGAFTLVDKLKELLQANAPDARGGSR